MELFFQAFENGRLPDDCDRKWMRGFLIACYGLKNSDELNQKSLKTVRKIVAYYGDKYKEEKVKEPIHRYVFSASEKDAKLKLPVLRWKSFRGYTFVAWIKVKSEGRMEDGGSVVLYKFLNKNKEEDKCKIGVEVKLDCFMGDKAKMTIRSSSASESGGLSMLKSKSKSWKSLSRTIVFSLDEWHAVAIVHSSHYVGKSKAGCYVDGKLQFYEDLPYPVDAHTNLPYCYVGSSYCGMEMAEIALYQDELSKHAVMLIYDLGPNQPSLVQPVIMPYDTQVISHDLHLYTLDPAMSGAPDHSMNKIKLVASYSAADLNPENNTIRHGWMPDGIQSQNGLYSNLNGISQSTLGQSAHVKEKFALLEGSIHTITKGNGMQHETSLWYRSGGILAILYMLDAVRVNTQIVESEDSETIQIMSDIIVKSIQLIRQLLENSPCLIQDTLRNHGLHVLKYILDQMDPCVINLQVLNATFDLIWSLPVRFPGSVVNPKLQMANMEKTSHSTGIVHLYFHPLFGAALNGILLDIDLWSKTNPQVQDSFFESLLHFVTKHPGVFNRIIGVEMLVDKIRLYSVNKQAVHVKKLQDTNFTASMLNGAKTLCHIVQYCITETINGSYAVIEPKLFVTTDAGTICIGLTTFLGTKALICFLLDCQAAELAPRIVELLIQLFQTDQTQVGAAFYFHGLLDALCLLLQRRAENIRMTALPLFLLVAEWMESDQGHKIVLLINEFYSKSKKSLLFQDNKGHIVYDIPYESMLTIASLTKEQQNATPPCPPAETLTTKFGILRRIAIRQLQSMPLVSSQNLVALMRLPICCTLPFLVVLIPKAPLPTQEEVIMAISVLLKTEELQLENLLSRMQWMNWMLDLLYASRSAAKASEIYCTMQTSDELVIDCIVTLVSAKMRVESGWYVWDDLTKAIRQRHDNSIENLHDLRKLAGKTLQRMSRDRPTLNRSITQNVGHLFEFLDKGIISSMDGEDIRHQINSESVVSRLVNSIVDMSTLLLSSTNKRHRSGLTSSLKIIVFLLPYAEIELLKRFVHVVKTILDQEASSGSVLQIYDNTANMMLQVLLDLRDALQMTMPDNCKQLLKQLVLDIVFNGSLNYELKSINHKQLQLMAINEGVDKIFTALTEKLDKVKHQRILDEQQAVEDDEMDCIKSTFLSYSQILSPYIASEHDDAQATAQILKSPGCIAVGNEGSIIEAEVMVNEVKLLSSIGSIRHAEKNRISNCKLKQKTLQESVRQFWNNQVHRMDSENQHWNYNTPLKSQHLLLVRKQEQIFLDEHEECQPGRMRRRMQTVGLENLPHFKPMEDEGEDNIEHGTDSEPSPSKKQTILEEVSRAIAKQGIILDITTTTSDPSHDIEDNGSTPPEDIDGASGRYSDSDLADMQVQADRKEEEEFWAQSERYRRSCATIEESQESKADIRTPAPFSWENYRYAGPVDYSACFMKSLGGSISIQSECRQVRPEGLVCGMFYVTKDSLIWFVPFAITNDIDIETTAMDSKCMDEDKAVGSYPVQRWKAKQLSAVYLRRYRLRNSGIELFFEKSNYFFEFPKDRRNDIVKHVLSISPNSVVKQRPDTTPNRLVTQAGVTKLWQQHKIGNFEYLMALNTLAGRSFNDLTQYPIFPWVLQDYESDSLDLTDPSVYRDLSKPIGALNPSRLADFQERYECFEDPDIPKFLYGSHYSTCAGVVLYFLLRLQPFNQLHIKLQGGKLDVADRIFFSLNETWKMCNSSMSEVKELTPEFFSTPEFLINMNQCPFGERQDGGIVDDVELPPWAKGSAEEFIRIHRAALESDIVSENLHHWIDLIFGYKQRGKEALKSHNVFYYLTYYGVIDVDSIEDDELRLATETQIAHFGQCPMQLFNVAHPKRRSVENDIARPLRLSFEDYTKSAQLRRQWEPIKLKPLGPTAVKMVHILRDRFVSINALGVVEMYHWQLFEEATDSNVDSPNRPSSRRITLQSSTISTSSPKQFSRRQGNGSKTKRHVEFTSTNSIKLTEDSEYVSDVSNLEHKNSNCSQPCWTLAVERDQTPFEIVPRLPMPAEGMSIGRNIPIASSSRGNVIVSGGSCKGSLYFSQIDMETGQLSAVGSVAGHDEFVTCINHDASKKNHSELWISGSSDTTLALWQLSKLSSALRTPRVTLNPIGLYLGHDDAIVDCDVNQSLGLILSCTLKTCIIHCIASRRVLFSFHAKTQQHFTQVRLSILGNTNMKPNFYVIFQ